MPNIHDVMNNPGEYVGKTCRKDSNDTKNQSYGYWQKAFFELYLIPYRPKFVSTWNFRRSKFSSPLENFVT